MKILLYFTLFITGHCLCNDYQLSMPTLPTFNERRSLEHASMSMCNPICTRDTTIECRDMSCVSRNAYDTVTDKLLVSGGPWDRVDNEENASCIIVAKKECVHFERIGCNVCTLCAHTGLPLIALTSCILCVSIKTMICAESSYDICINPGLDMCCTHRTKQSIAAAGFSYLCVPIAGICIANLYRHIHDPASYADTESL
jgi:hypothetical protein